MSTALNMNYEVAHKLKHSIIRHAMTYTYIF